MGMVKCGDVLVVVGNYDDKFCCWFDGKIVCMIYGIEEIVEQFEWEDVVFKVECWVFIWGLLIYFILDEGELLVVYVGLVEKFYGWFSGEEWFFVMFGDVVKQCDQYGLLVCLNWVVEYLGKCMVVYGYVVELDVCEFNNVYCIDIGCCFGGYLMVMCWLECELVQVQVKEVYFYLLCWVQVQMIGFGGFEVVMFVWFCSLFWSILRGGWFGVVRL